MSSEKDIKDARHRYKPFQETLDTALLREFNQKLKVEHEFEKHLA